MALMLQTNQIYNTFFVSIFTWQSGPKHIQKIHHLIIAPVRADKNDLKFVGMGTLLEECNSCTVDTSDRRNKRPWPYYCSGYLPIRSFSARNLEPSDRRSVNRAGVRGLPVDFPFPLDGLAQDAVDLAWAMVTFLLESKNFLSKKAQNR